MEKYEDMKIEYACMYINHNFYHQIETKVRGVPQMEKKNPQKFK